MIAALAAPMGASAKTDLATRLAAIEAECFAPSWAETKCSFEKLPPQAMYGITLLDRVISQVTVETVSDLLGLTTTVQSYIEPARLACGEDGQCYSAKLGVGLLNTLGAKLREKAKRERLNQCKTACLAKCVSSRLLEYEVSASAKIMPAAINALQGEGSCSEFAGVYKKLALGAGIRTELLYTIRHAFNQVSIDGTWYYVEPQSGNCSFYFEPYKP